jgi:hypothetical protein
VTLLAYDRSRLDSLRTAIGDALEDLQRIRCNDLDAADTMRTIRAGARTLDEMCLSRVREVLGSEAMTSYRSSAVDGRGVSDGTVFAIARERSWETTTDPAVFGPPAPHLLTFDEVLANAHSGVLIPMAAPLDANGRAGAHYTSLAFAPERSVLLGEQDTTPSVVKLIDYASDALPVGWHEHATTRIYRLENVRVTSSVHVLTAYDPDEGPETLLESTTEATSSGYMVIRSDDSVGQVEMTIGPGEQDPTQSFPIASQELSAYTAVFYPDASPKFEKRTNEPRYESPNAWTVTTSASPMVEGWGTWQT